MKRLMIAAVLTAAAVGTEAFGDVAGFARFDCSDEIASGYATAAEACAADGIRAYRDMDDMRSGCTVCDDDDDGGGIGTGGGTIIIRPASCPAGTHKHGGACHADHVCGDDQIGGGSVDCKNCPPGTDANEAGTDCVPNGDYQVGRCIRPVQLPAGAGHLLPHHANAAVKKYWAGRYEAELGFFAHDWHEAIANAALAEGVLVSITPLIYIPGRIVLSSGSVQADSATCTFENVTKERYETVRNRMDTYAWTNRYHLTRARPGENGYGNCIDWANNVLAP